MKPITILLVMSLVAGAAYAQTSQAKDSDKDVIAVVLGKTITVKDKDKLNGLIFGTLLEQFANDNKFEPTEEELDAFVLKTEEMKRQQQIKLGEYREKLVAELKATTLSERERKDKKSQLKNIESLLKTTREVIEEHREKLVAELKATTLSERERKDKKSQLKKIDSFLTKGMEEQRLPMKRQNARFFVRRWKINKALYAKYGGRVIFQQAGVEPLDAYRDFLREQEKNEAFQILDKKYEAPFWRYFTNDAMHSFYPKGDGSKAINTPWWMMERPLGE